VTYTSASNVLPYVRTLFKGGTFDETTFPTAVDVNAWLDAGYSRINGELEARGYSTPVPSTATCYSEIKHLESLFAAAWVYEVRMVQGNTAGGETKGNFLLQEFEREMTKLLARDLSSGTSPLTTTGTTGQPYAGGISIGDKDSVEDDSDRVAPAFKRGMHDSPGIVWGKDNEGGNT
jgi:hypothetical protein